MRNCLALGLLVAACADHHATVPAPDPAYDRQRRPELVIAALELEDGARVADVGAGAGYLTARLAAAAGPRGHVVATDIDARALEVARARAIAAGVADRVETRVVAPDEPGLEAGSYDVVLLAQVDHLLADRTAYLRRLAPALAPGGRLAVSNRIGHRAPLLAAAAGAGLRVVDERDDLPGQFLIRFEVIP